MNHHYEVFSIGDKSNNYAIGLTQRREPSNSYQSERKAHSDHTTWPQYSPNTAFVDNNFQIDTNKSNQANKSSHVKLRRIYEIYDQEFKLFEDDWFKNYQIKSQSSYPTFLAEFIMLDQEYVKTLFFTKDINKEGFYQYFIRRNGQFYVEFIDDWIPVDQKQQKPIWGLSEEQPWKLILMKAWIKQKGGIRGVIQAQPYEFIQAFGAPGYRILSIKKQIEHLKVSLSSEQSKEAKINKIPFHDESYIAVGKTLNNKKVTSLGLVPNQAGYKISSVKKYNPLKSQINSKSASTITQKLFRVRSTIPSCWTGRYSVLSHKFSSQQLEIGAFDIERQFFASYEEISSIFSSFYVVPRYKQQPSTFQSKLKIKNVNHKIIEQSLFLPVTKTNPHHFFELIVQQGGIFNINVQLPFSSRSNIQQNEVIKKRYPPIKLFLSHQKQLSVKNIMFSYEYYDGDYVKGYYKNLNRFIEIMPGKYYVFVKIDTSQYKTPSFTVNINTNAIITSFKEALNLSGQNKSLILKSSLYSYAEKYGIRTYTDEKIKDRRIYLCNSFDQIGFGIVAIYVDARSNIILGMKVDASILKQNHIQLCPQVHGLINEDQNQSLNFIDKGNAPKIIVMEKQDRISNSEKQFPPDKTFDFYEVYDK